VLCCVVLYVNSLNNKLSSTTCFDLYESSSYCKTYAVIAFCIICGCSVIGCLLLTTIEQYVLICATFLQSFCASHCALCLLQIVVASSHIRMTHRCIFLYLFYIHCTEKCRCAVRFNGVDKVPVGQISPAPPQNVQDSKVCCMSRTVPFFWRQVVFWHLGGTSLIIRGLGATGFYTTCEVCVLFLCDSYGARKLRVFTVPWNCGEQVAKRRGGSAS
jgi:hypothetical protein